jgi:predicted lactoylglutathione lyase
MLSITRYGTKDVARAGAFYDEIAGMLGASRINTMPNMIVYKSAESAMFIIGEPFEGEATAGNGTQIGIAAPTRAVVDAVHAKAIELGGKCEGKPGIRGDDPDGFYGAYFRDLDGNKLTVFRFGPA